MENTETRSALFTVRDAEDALIRFTLTLLTILIGIFLHEILLKARAWGDAFYTMLGSKPHALAWATGVTMSLAGGIIMFSRLQDYRDRRKRRFDEAEAKGKAEVYGEIAAWNSRRLAAEARNEPFTEPFPAPPEPPADAS
ncbi:hypothetical protein F4X88_13930 [Candidatus Poribacteria bacterium]|nr:hypothetical protein [Candidatus Poribacteria bacterium]MYA57388.1 hypothetical protein [Candidatus Poribacteria bacterium]